MVKVLILFPPTAISNHSVAGFAKFNIVGFNFCKLMFVKTLDVPADPVGATVIKTCL